MCIYTNTYSLVTPTFLHTEEKEQKIREKDQFVYKINHRNMSHSQCNKNAQILGCANVQKVTKFLNFFGKEVNECREVRCIELKF